MLLLVFFPPSDLHWFITEARCGELNPVKALQQWWAGGSRNTFGKCPPVCALPLVRSLPNLISMWR